MKGLVLLAESGVDAPNHVRRDELFAGALLQLPQNLLRVIAMPRHGIGFRQQRDKESSAAGLDRPSHCGDGGVEVPGFEVGNAQWPVAVWNIRMKFHTLLGLREESIVLASEPVNPARGGISRVGEW